MGRCRVVVPEVVRLSLSDGDYVDVKKTLNAGEYRDLIADSAGDSHFGEVPTVNMRRIAFARILQYLVGWSLVGPNNAPVPYSLDQPEAVRLQTLRGLDVETFREITAAIDTHDALVGEGRAAKKPTTAGEPAFSAT